MKFIIKSIKPQTLIEQTDIKLEQINFKAN